MMPLTMAKAGETVTIKKITGRAWFCGGQRSDRGQRDRRQPDRTGQGKPPGTRQDDGKSHYDRLNSAARCLGPAPTLEWSLNKDK